MAERPWILEISDGGAIPKWQRFGAYSTRERAEKVARGFSQRCRILHRDGIYTLPKGVGRG